MLTFIPEVRSLIKTLKENDFQIISGSDGEESFKFDTMSRTEFLESVTACDEGYLKVRYNEQNYTIFLVYGNEPGEVICDYSSLPELDQVAEAHYDKWQNRKQPTI
jgi:hypothetical protein